MKAAMLALLLCAFTRASGLEDLFASIPTGSVDELAKRIAPENVNAISSKTHMTLLMTAVTANRSDMVTTLLRLGADPSVRNQDSLGLRPLDGAAWLGMAEVVRLLLVLGAPCNEESGDGLRPIHRAAYGASAGHTLALEHLFIMCNGLQVDVATKTGVTALQFAVRAKEKNEATIKLLANNGASLSGLSDAELEIVKHARRQRLPAQELNKQLLEAVAKDSLVGVVDALKSGADVNTQDKDSKQTALMTASLRGNAAIVDELLSHWHADPTIGEQQGYTPFHGAGFQGRAEVARVLLKHGLDANDRHKDGYAPIHRACWGSELRHAEFIRAIAEGGADVNLKNAQGQTPLQMIATHSHNKAAAAVLVDRGATLQGLSKKQMLDLGVIPDNSKGDL